MKLRPYQERAIADLRAAYGAGKRAPILVMGTGSGKTVVSAELIRLSIEKGNQVLFAVPRIEILNQSASKLDAAGCRNVRTIQAQNDIGPADAPVVVASIPTLTTKRWMENPPKADLVVIDECHHGKATTHEKFFRLYQHSKLLGLSATPQRGDGQALGDLFDAIVPGASIRELTEVGALVPCKVFAPPRIIDSRELAVEPLTAYQQRTPGQKAFVFCSTVEHAQQTSDSFNQAGICSRWLCGESPDRAEILEQFSRRDFDVLVNVSVLVEGFDDPGIEAAILARRFTHVGPYLQAIGRILRPHPGKQLATVVDLCGSALVHGTPDLEREYSLDGKGIKSTRQPVRQCQSCGGVFTSLGNCPYCGFAVPPLTRAQLKAQGLELAEVTKQTAKTSWPMRAKRNGSCAECRGPIVPGAWIIYSSTKNTAMHTGCAAKRRAA